MTYLNYLLPHGTIVAIFEPERPTPMKSLVFFLWDLGPPSRLLPVVKSMSAAQDRSIHSTKIRFLNLRYGAYQLVITGHTTNRFEKSEGHTRILVDSTFPVVFTASNKNQIKTRTSRNQNYIPNA